MATTLSWLQNREHAHIAITAQFDGWTTAWTTTDDTAGMLTAYAATDVAAVKAGVDLIGEIGQSIALFQPKVDAETITLRILEDEAWTLTGAMLRLASSADYKTVLDEDLLPAGTSVSTLGRAAFPASGSIYVGHERIDYSAHTTDASGYTTTFSTLTRGVGSLFQTYDGTAFSAPHLVQRNVVAGDEFAPPVTSQPRTWYNRPVALYLHHYEGGAWSTVANSRLLFVGRIKKWKDEGNGWISIELRSIKERLHDLVMADQWSAEIAEGAYVRSTESNVHIGGAYAGTPYAVDSTLATSDTNVSWETCLNDLASICAVGSDANVRLDAKMIRYNGQPRVEISVTKQTGNFEDTDLLAVSLHPKVWWLLGFLDAVNEFPSGAYDDGNGYLSLFDASQGAVPTRRIVAGRSPVVYATTPDVGAIVNVQNAKGTWADQPTGSVPTVAGANMTGVVRIGDTFYGATLNVSTLTLGNRFTSSTGAVASPSGSNGSVRLDEDPGTFPRVSQIWWEHNRPGTLLNRLALSTGSAAYNDATLDVYAAGFGLAFPCSIWDQTSFAAIDEDAPEFDLVLMEPTKFSTILETICGVTNRYPIWRNGKVTACRPPTENSYADGASYDLTEDNKARPDDRIRVEHAPEGVINKARLDFHWDFIADKATDYVEIILLASQTDNGVGYIRHSGRGFRTDAAWGPVLAALPNYASPPAVLSRTYNSSLIDLEPTALVVLDDDYMLDPVTGERGVTDLPAWVLSTTFDLRSGVGRVEAVFAPHVHPAKKCIWAPSIAVDQDQGTNGYTSGTKTLYLESHSYSASDDDVDGTRIPTGSKIRVIQADPATAATPQTWTDTVATGGTTSIVLTTGLAGYSSTDRYVVEFDDVSTVVAAQTASGAAFIADDATGSTGAATNDARLYGADSSEDAGSVLYSVEYARPYSIADNAGEPLSVHKAFDLVNSANNYLGRKGNQTLACDILPTAVDNAENQTTTELMYGPIALPVYKHPTRTLKVRLFGYCGTEDRAGNMTVKCSSAPARGSSFTSFEYPSDGQTSAAISLPYGTAAAWSAEATLRPVTSGANPPVTYLTVEGVCTDSCTVYLSGVYVADNEL